MPLVQKFHLNRNCLRKNVPITKEILLHMINFIRNFFIIKAKFSWRRADKGPPLAVAPGMQRVIRNFLQVSVYQYGCSLPITNGGSHKTIKFESVA